MYEIIVQHPAERFIKSLKTKEQKKILDAIEQLAEKPFLGKELVGRLAGLRSIHIGAYRVVYRTENTQIIVLILRAGYRGNIYSQKFRK
ncbi:MAG TPA: type II toxin-antitoxin system RelE/ParE family toxin [Candidatus Nanoarchaeia archaeon]|nr:type II toxin-antitoxin system RelE/ParE family toxin [Candidatus Nanoarchaeia archaeon]